MAKARSKKAPPPAPADLLPARPRFPAGWSGAELEARLGIEFRDPGLLLEALTHRSWRGVEARRASPDYERLEFLGDAALGLRVGERLLAAFPAAGEGQLSRLRSWLVSARNLAAAAQRLDLGRHLRMSKGEEAVGGRGKERLLANAMESVIGAAHLDRGYAVAAALVDRHVLGDSLDRLTPDHLHEFAFKSALQEWAHARGQSPPRYRVLGATGPEHGKIFEVEVELPGEYTGAARGRTKKEAEQRAARAALVALGAVPAADVRD